MRCVIHRCSSCGISWYKMARAAAGAGLRGGGSPARVFWAMLGATGYGNWRKGRRCLGCSSPSSELDGEAAQGSRRRRGRAAAMRELRGPGAGVLLRASDPLESLRRGTAGVEGDQEDRSWTGGEEFW